jgi:hypothetical protein
MDSVTTFAHYRVRPGSEEAFLSLIARHWPLLRELELVENEPARVYLGTEDGIPGPLVMEVFEWVSLDASRRAATHPRVTAIWEAMGPLCEERGGRPRFEFATMRPVQPAAHDAGPR